MDRRYLLYLTNHLMKKPQKRSQYQKVNVAIRTNLLFTQKKTREKNVNIP